MKTLKRTIPPIRRGIGAFRFTRPDLQLKQTTSSPPTDITLKDTSTKRQDPSIMSDMNILVEQTGEVISLRMSRHITELALRGCTEECIPCHFREVWNREIDQDSVLAVLEQDTEYTDQPVTHGERLLADGWTAVPNGIVSEMIRLTSIAKTDSIAVYLTMRYPALPARFTEELVERVLNDVAEQLVTGPDGNTILDPSLTRRWEPSGHRIGSLPTTPLTPRNDGRPRSSHQMPPPTYSPCRPEGHPRQVLAPLELLERPPSYRNPPSYVGQFPPLDDADDNDPDDDSDDGIEDFLASLDNFHILRTPFRRAAWEFQTGRLLLDRRSRPAPIRTPPPSMGHPGHREIAPFGESSIPSHASVRPTILSPRFRQSPTQRHTPTRRPTPIITSPNNVRPPLFLTPSWGSQEPGVVIEQARPTVRPTRWPTGEEFDIDIAYDYDISSGSESAYHITSETVFLPSPSHGPTDSPSSSSSSSSSSSPSSPSLFLSLSSTIIFSDSDSIGDGHISE